jgi:disulfide bond formation protein DsbB
MLLDQPAAPPCDQVQWSLFGISMAGYNMLYAALLAAITLIFGTKNDSQANSS